MPHYLNNPYNQLETRDDEEGNVLWIYFEHLEHKSSLADSLSSAPLKLLQRSATLLYKQATIYLREGDMQTAYTLYLRFCKLCIDANLASSNSLLKPLIKEAVEEMERIKPVLIEAVKREYRKRKLEETKQKLSELRKSTNEVKKESVMVDESLLGLRRVGIPNGIIDAFRELARGNTERGIETCAVLAGTLTRNKLNIAALILPRQHATSDTCTMTHEEELVEIQDQQDLLVLGWIHTHPTQGLFLSSVDLHTHYGFQVLVPEAIAIVIAPTCSADKGYGRDWGVFRITDMNAIGSCRRSGFHPHPLPDNQIYQEVYAEIEWLPSTQIKVFDLRL